MLGRVVDPIIRVIDVDDIVHRIDVNDLVRRIDWNQLLDSVDLDRQLDRIDLDRMLQRVDMKALMDRAEIGAIVARSTAGVVSPLIDAIRSQIVIVDQLIQGHGLCRSRRVPTAPGLPLTFNLAMPNGSSNIAVVVQERYAGTFSRGLAYLIDQLILTALFTFVTFLFEKAIELFFRVDVEINAEESSWPVVLFWLFWSMLYFFTSVAAVGRTIGKAVLGLRVVNYEDGSRTTMGRALLRAVVQPFCIYTIVGVLLGLVRSDRRELHDLMAHTGVVYSWDARMAKYRQEQMDQHMKLYTGSSLMVEDTESTRRPRFRLFHPRQKQAPRCVGEQRGTTSSLVASL